MEEDLKSLARSLVGFVNHLVAVCAGAWFVLAYFEAEPRVAPGVLALGGAALLVVNVFRLVYLRAGPRREFEGPLLSQTPEGPIRVSREAVESGLRSAGEQLDSVTRLRVKILTPGKHKVLVRAHYLAPEGVPILDLSSRLRNTLKGRFAELVSLGRDDALEIEILFEGFYGKPAEAAPAPEPEPAEAEEPERPPFTGPRYPIDAGGDEL